MLILSPVLLFNGLTMEKSLRVDGGRRWEPNSAAANLAKLAS